jgi:hypothetical protein
MGYPKLPETIALSGIMLPSNRRHAWLAAVRIGVASGLSTFAPTPSRATPRLSLVGIINETVPLMPTRASATVLQGAAIARR